MTIVGVPDVVVRQVVDVDLEPVRIEVDVRNEEFVQYIISYTTHPIRID